MTNKEKFQWAVTPLKIGVQPKHYKQKFLDTGFRRYDEQEEIRRCDEQGKIRRYDNPKGKTHLLCTLFFNLRDHFSEIKKV